MIKKGAILEEILVEDFAAESKCVARVDGQVIFIEQTAPGDVVDIRITRKKKNFLEARPVYFHEFSNMRDTPFCGHYGICGGCKWQHVHYVHQLDFKQQQVLDQLQRIGHVHDINFDPILGAPHQVGYRNKLEFTFTDQRWLTDEEIKSGDTFERRGLGFHKPGQFDKVLDIEQCYLQPTLSNQIRLKVKEISLRENIPFYNLRTHKGFVRNLIIRNNEEGQWMVILQVKNENKEWINMILGEVMREYPQVISAFYIVNPKLNESYNDLEAIHFGGEAYITERMGELIFRISPKSFFQTNTRQALAMFDLVKKYAGFKTDDIVYDLYSGTGTIANFIAGDVAKVIGLEYVAEAVEDARVNSTINQIANTEFIEGDMAKVFNEDLMIKHGKPDIIIADPPRAGLHQDVIHALLQAPARRIIYISCNPATQARDIHLLSEGYSLLRSQAVDMFPHTQHIENLTILEKINHE